MPFSGAGAGTDVDPYIITNRAQLLEIADDLTAVYECTPRLTVDLEGDQGASGAYWNGGEGVTQLGDLSGKLYGKGLRIDNFFQDQPGGEKGLFNNVSGLLHDVSIGGDLTTDDQVNGLLAADIIEGADVKRCAGLYGTVTSTRSAAIASGGLFGQFKEGVEDCWSAVDVVSTNNQGRVGCITGIARNPIQIRRMLGLGVLTTTSTGKGGVSGISVGGSDVEIYNSVWNSETTNATVVGGGGNGTGNAGLTTAQIADISNFISRGWDIVEEANHDGDFATAVWYHDGTQPRLWFEKEVVEAKPSGTITYQSNPVGNARVEVMEAVNLGKETPVVKEVVTTDPVTGVWTGTLERDASKNTWGECIHNLPISGLSGTISSVDGTDPNQVTLGVDLSALETLADQAYTVEVTDGANAEDIFLIDEFVDKAAGIVKFEYHNLTAGVGFQVNTCLNVKYSGFLPKSEAPA